MVTSAWAQYVVLSAIMHSSVENAIRMLVIGRIMFQDFMERTFWTHASRVTVLGPAGLTAI